MFSQVESDRNLTRKTDFRPGSSLCNIGYLIPPLIEARWKHYRSPCGLVPSSGLDFPGGVGSFFAAAEPGIPYLN